MELMTSWEGKGVQRGRHEEGLTIILRQLTHRVGPLTPDIEARLHRLSLEALEALGEALFDFSDATDLVVWLQQHPA
jgi:hypothetical protein